MSANNFQVIFTAKGKDYCREPYIPTRNPKLLAITGRTDDLQGAEKWAAEQVRMHSKSVDSYRIENWA